MAILKDESLKSLKLLERQETKMDENGYSVGERDLMDTDISVEENEGD